MADSFYFICTNPRSGSWLLSEGLGSTGLAGNPREWFQDEEEKKFRGEWGITDEAAFGYDAYLQRVLEHGTTANGVFGAKVMYYQFVQLPAKLARLRRGSRTAAAVSLTDYFPGLEHIWLTRRDKARAGHFLLPRDQDRQVVAGRIRGRAGAAGRPPDFDPEAVERLEQELLQCDLGWQRYFNFNRITPLTLTYEELDADYYGVIGGVLGWLGAAAGANASVAAPRLRKQADAQTEEWLERYLRFKARRGAPVTQASRPPDDATGGPGPGRPAVAPGRPRSRLDRPAVPRHRDSPLGRVAAVGRREQAAGEHGRLHRGGPGPQRPQSRSRLGGSPPGRVAPVPPGRRLEHPAAEKNPVAPGGTGPDGRPRPGGGGGGTPRGRLA